MTPLMQPHSLSLGTFPVPSTVFLVKMLAAWHRPSKALGAKILISHWDSEKSAKASFPFAFASQLLASALACKADLSEKSDWGSIFSYDSRQ